jgi:hypothetical protein
MCRSGPHLTGTPCTGCEGLPGLAHCPPDGGAVCGWWPDGGGCCGGCCPCGVGPAEAGLLCAAAAAGGADAAAPAAAGIPELCPPACTRYFWVPLGSLQEAGMANTTELLTGCHTPVDVPLVAFASAC